MVNFFEQPLTNIQVGDYQLEAPESHILVQIGKKQPYRDLCVGISAKYLSEKYQDSVMIDVGVFKKGGALGLLSKQGTLQSASGIMLFHPLGKS